jgi:hypothetical protein
MNVILKKVISWGLIFGIGTATAEKVLAEGGGRAGGNTGVTSGNSGGGSGRSGGNGTATGVGTGGGESGRGGGATGTGTGNSGGGGGREGGNGSGKGPSGPSNPAPTTPSQNQGGGGPSIQDEILTIRIQYQDYDAMRKVQLDRAHNKYVKAYGIEVWHTIDNSIIQKNAKNPNFYLARLADKSFIVLGKDPKDIENYFKNLEAMKPATPVATPAPAAAPVYNREDNIIYVEKIVEKPVEVIKEVPVEVEKVVYKDKIVEVPVDRVVYKDRVVEKPVEVIKVVKEQVPVEVEKVVYKDKIVEVPTERIVYVDRDRVVVVDREVPVDREKIVYVDKITKQVVEKEKIVYVEKEVPVDREVTKEVIKVVEKTSPKDTAKGVLWGLGLAGTLTVAGFGVRKLKHVANEHGRQSRRTSLVKTNQRTQSQYYGR